MVETSKSMEPLCEKEFELARAEAFEGLDQEVASIKNHMASRGLIRSSPMAIKVTDAVLARFDRVLRAFECIYIGKWAETDNALSDADLKWLKSKTIERLEPEIVEVKRRSSSALWDDRATFAMFWDRAEVEARKRYIKVFDKIEVIRLKKGLKSAPASAPKGVPLGTNDDLWRLLHPTIVKIAKPRFDSGHFADSVEASFKEVNDILRQIVRKKTGEEFDGADLMYRAFSPKNPVVILDDPTTTTGRDIQQGYMQIFAGAMTGIRNPKAHANIQIDSVRALHFLFLASLLLHKIEESH